MFAVVEASGGGSPKKLNGESLLEQFVYKFTVACILLYFCSAYLEGCERVTVFFGNQRSYPSQMAVDYLYRTVYDSPQNLVVEFVSQFVGFFDAFDISQIKLQRTVYE